jgi:protein-S-isoprenylcysteine O-methyltransferase Ste14
MNTDFILFFCLFLLTLIIRSIYEILKKAGKANPGSKILFVVIFTDMCLLWASWFGMCPIDPMKFTFPGVIHLIGLVLVVIGIILAIGALVQLRGLENIDHLVSTGLFSYIRHPMYTGFILWILGFSLYHGAFISFIIGLFGIANILYWRQLEEDKLESIYGEEYLLLRNRTWF